MPNTKRPRTPAQLANDERLRNRTVNIQEDKTDHIAPEQDYDELKRQITELKAMFFDSGKGNQVQMGRKGSLIGETDKYSTDQNKYPDPTPRLRQEKRLQPIAFDYNYELEYAYSITSYETKAGLNMREPKFSIALNRIVIDDQGEQTNKRYIARKLIFHEDTDAALAIARENGIEISTDNEEDFLNEMRYLRVRDWLFDVFWPKPADPKAQIREESIGGQIVQVFTKSSENSSEIDFSSLGDKKLRV